MPVAAVGAVEGVGVSEIVVERRMRGFISLTAHPDGCAANVRDQIGVVRAGVDGRYANALVLGSSTGYGLASALAACFGLGAATLGVCFEREPEDAKTGSAGWYNLAEAHRQAAAAGLHLETINGDAFSEAVKDRVIDALRRRFGQLDLVVYSLAAPRRSGPDGESWSSVLKPIGSSHRGKGIDLRRRQVVELSIEPATPEEVDATINVMGGEDWQAWIDCLDDAGLLADGCRTVAYSYIGPRITAPIYRDGTIGEAKKHLEATAGRLRHRLAARGGGAWVAVNKGVVTQASAAIPAVPLYLSILRPVMSEAGVDEEPIDQIVRLFADHLGPGRTPTLDAESRIRLDDRELRDDIQAEVLRRWDAVTSENVGELADLDGYTRAFNQLFGFDVDGIDESLPTDIARVVPSA